METINQLVKTAMQSGQPTSPPPSLTTAQKEFLQRYSTAEAVMRAYIPEDCSKFALCADRCHMGNYLTLADFRAMHGQKWAILWLENQLRALSEFAGVKSKFTTEQLTAAAATIYAEAFYLKLPELMLFFHRFRAGYYEQFYGAADPMRVTAALLKFREERAAAIDRLQREATTRAIIQEDRSDAMTYEEWQSKQTTP